MAHSIPTKKNQQNNQLFICHKSHIVARISFLYIFFLLFISFCHKIHFHHTPHFASLFFGKLKCLTEFFFFFRFQHRHSETHSNSESLILFFFGECIPYNVIIPFIRCLWMKEKKHCISNKIVCLRCIVKIKY